MGLAKNGKRVEFIFNPAVGLEIRNRGERRNTLQ